VVRPLISTGSRVSTAAVSGRAVLNIPSPVLDTTTDAQTARNGRPRLPTPGTLRVYRTTPVSGGRTGRSRVGR
jgi:hypothetical protein